MSSLLASGHRNCCRRGVFGGRGGWRSRALGGFWDCAIIIMASSAPECLRGAAGASSGREIRHRRVRRHRSRRSVLVTSGRWAGRWRNLPRPRVRASSGCHEDTHEVAGVLGEGAVLRRGLQGLFRCEEQNLPRPLVRASSGCRGDTHEVAGVLSEEVVLQRWLQGLPAGAGWYVPEGSGAGPWRVGRPHTQARRGRSRRS